MLALTACAHRTPRAEAMRAVRLGSAIYRERKNMYKAKRLLVAQGVQDASIGELLHFFYGQFRHSDVYPDLKKVGEPYRL